MLSLLHQKVIDNFQPFFLIVIHTLPIISFGIPEHSCRRYRWGGRLRDCLSNISDSPGISLIYSSPFDICLIFVFLHQIQRLPSKKIQNNCFTGSGNITTFCFYPIFHLTSILSFSKHQLSCKNHQSSHKMLSLILVSRYCYLHLLLHRLLMKFLKSSKIFHFSRNPERQHSINIPFFLTRHKTIQTTVYFLFNLGLSVQKMKPCHQQNRLHCLKKPRPNSMKSCSCWTKTLANWFKMLIRFALS